MGRVTLRMPRMHRAVQAFWLFAVVSVAAVTIDNTSPRIDTAGNIVNAHDGNLLRLDDGKFWMFGTRYPDCVLTGEFAQPHCGWGMRPNPPNSTDCWGMWADNDFAAYSSTNLVDWQLENPSILPSHQRPRGTYFRPKVLHAPQNEIHERYVLWGNYVNMSLGGTSGFYFSAVSERPQGPYTIKHWNISMGSNWAQNGDFAVFVDRQEGTRQEGKKSDDQAYIAYHGYGCPFMPDVPGTPCRGPDGYHAVDLLSDDYTQSTRKTSGLFDIRGSEAPVMFKRNGTYFVITATGCGFCPDGSDARPWTATTPLGPYTDSGRDLNPCRNQSVPNCGMEKYGVDGSNGVHIIPAQQAFVLQLPQVDGAPEQWIWAGDSWESTPDHLKSHDFQLWAPLQFDKDGMPLPLKNVKSFEVEVSLVA